MTLQPHHVAVLAALLRCGTTARIAVEAAISPRRASSAVRELHAAGLLVPIGRARDTPRWYRFSAAGRRLVAAMRWHFGGTR